VKKGFSWPAFIFNFPWMIVKRLWMHAGLYLIACIIISWVDKIADKANTGILDLFMSISILILLLIPGFMGNKWRCRNLITKGYKYLDTIRAESTKAAITQVSVTNKFIEIYSTVDQSELLVVKSVLDSEKIPYQILGNSLGLLTGAARVLIQSEQLEKAQQLLKQVARRN
jgi:hypothetical protein